MKPPTLHDPGQIRAYLTRKLRDTRPGQQRKRRFQHGLTCLVNRIAKLEGIEPSVVRKQLETRTAMLGQAMDTDTKEGRS